MGSVDSIEQQRTSRPNVRSKPYESGKPLYIAAYHYSVNRSDYQFYTRAGVFEKKGKQMECARKQTIHNSSVDTARVVFFHNLYIVSATLTVIKYIFEQSTESASFL